MTTEPKFYACADDANGLAGAVVLGYKDGNGNFQPIGSASPQPISAPPVLRSSAAAAVTAGAYASGDAVGALWTFSNIARVAGAGGRIDSAVLRDKSGNSVPYDLFLFDSQPTAPTDKSAYAFGADLAKCIGSISFAGMVNGGTPGLISVDGIAKAFELTSGMTLYGVLVARGAPTYASTSDVSIDLVNGSPD